MAASDAASSVAKLVTSWLGWFDADEDDEAPFFPERRVEIADHLREVRAVLAEREQYAARVTELEAERDARPRPYLTTAIATITPELEAKLRAAFAAKVTEPEPCDGDCDCDCQPGQDCLCPERDCYCGPCPVCGPTPNTATNETGD